MNRWFVGARNLGTGRVFVLRMFERANRATADALHDDLARLYGLEPGIDVLFGMYEDPEGFFMTEPGWSAGFEEDRTFSSGLLSAEDIRAIRERFELNQPDLARLLRLGANTVSLWESGRNVQTGAMDTLLRLVRDLPGSIDYLRDHAA